MDGKMNACANVSSSKALFPDSHLSASLHQALILPTNVQGRVFPEISLRLAMGLWDLWYTQNWKYLYGRPPRPPPLWGPRSWSHVLWTQTQQAFLSTHIFHTPEQTCVSQNFHVTEAVFSPGCRCICIKGENVWGGILYNSVNIFVFLL